MRRSWQKRPRMVRLLVSRYGLLLPLLLLAVWVHSRLEDWQDAPAAGDDAAGFDMRDTRSDYYLEAFRTRKFDADGKPEYRVSGDSLTHYPDARPSDILAPDIALIEADGEWQVTARRAQFTEEPALFRLSEDVVIARRGGRPDEAVVIQTAALDLLPTTREVRTDEAIEVVADTWQLRAVGLRSNLDTGNLQLLNEVTGTYAAPSSNEN